MISIDKIRHALTPTLWWSSNRNDLPNKKVILTFRLKYSKARKVEWSRIDNDRWQVFFESTKNKHWTIYTNDAKWLETTVTADLKNIPVKIREHFEINYNTRNLQHIYKIQTYLKTIFELQLDNEIAKEQLVYDENGKMLGKMIIEQ